MVITLVRKRLFYLTVLVSASSFLFLGCGGCSGDCGKSSSGTGIGETDIDLSLLAPTNLQALTQSSSAIALTWEDNAQNENGYKIYRDGTLIHVTVPDTTHYLDDNLDPLTEYSYEVAASANDADSKSATDINTTLSNTPKYWIWAESKKENEKPIKAADNKEIVITLSEPIEVQDMEALSSNTISNVNVENFDGQLITLNYDKKTNDEQLTIKTKSRANTSFEITQSYRPVMKTGMAGSSAQGLQDDGFYQKGLSRKMINQDDVVIDDNTGLIWQNEPYTEEEKKAYHENTFENESGKVGRYEYAKNYCTNLNLIDANTGWRLPTVQELASLINKGVSKPSIDSQFTNSESYEYWTSTTNSSDSQKQYIVNFQYGDIKSYSAANSFYIRCVRGEPMNNKGDYKKSFDNSTLLDVSTGLMWQDNEEAKTVTKTWKESIAYCEESKLGGYNNWRLPNFNELVSVLDSEENDTTIDDTFKNVTNTIYWTSTQDETLKDYANVINFENATTGAKDTKSNIYNLRCVRDLTVNR